MRVPTNKNIIVVYKPRYVCECSASAKRASDFVRDINRGHSVV